MVKKELEGIPINNKEDLSIYKKYLDSYDDVFIYYLRKAFITPIQNLSSVFKVTSHMTLIDSFKNYVAHGDLIDMVLYSNLCHTEILELKNPPSFDELQDIPNLDRVRLSQFKKSVTLLDLLSTIDGFDKDSFEKGYVQKYIHKIYNLISYSFEHQSYLSSFKPMVISDKYF